ncbi:MAG: DUF502 domain-containing protein [Euryarchaeota archaeon]|nr:DUF502 domain-containing protein [Euryarchaeota archaeon]
MLKYIKTYLLTGLVIVIPAVATIYIFYYVFTWINSIIEGIASEFLYRYLPEIPGLTMIISLVIIFAIGIFASISVGKSLLKYIDKWMSKVPLVSELYFTIKQASETILIQKEGFERAVLVEYPRKGVFALGFVTGESYREIKESADDNKLINVFIPTSPNPTSGYLVFVQKSEVRDVNLSIREAIKIIISGGFLKKEELKEK